MNHYTLMKRLRKYYPIGMKIKIEHVNIDGSDYEEGIVIKHLIIKGNPTIQVKCDYTPKYGASISEFQVNI